MNDASASASASTTPGIAPRSLTVQAVDGHRADLALLQPDGARHGLVFLPALGVPARKYLGFAQALAGAGIAVALPEWRGLDTSTWRARRGTDWGYATLLADLADARAMLAREAPAIAWRVGGHSLGAQLAALGHALAPDHYRGVAIVASGAPYWRTFPGWRRAQLLFAFALFRTLAAAVGYFPGTRTGFAGNEARGVMRDWTRSGWTGRYAPARVETDLEAALARLARPVLALRLRDDTLVPEASLAHLLAKLPRAPQRVERLDPEHFASGRADHFSWLRDPQPVAQRLADWFAATAD